MGQCVGRRVASIAEIEQPGDYCGPVDEVDGDDRHIGRAVWFLLPIADPADPFRQELHDRAGWIATRANGLHRVAEPPWTFRECSDGSLEIRASILCGAHEADCEPYWHGYLDEGHVWRNC
ncbi:MAG: hypothetical protein ACRDYZ_09110 [Acidimicrobiales bacterium]